MHRLATGWQHTTPHFLVAALLPLLDAPQFVLMRLGMLFSERRKPWLNSNKGTKSDMGLMRQGEY
jgi:hypothetical protein